MIAGLENGTVDIICSSHDPQDADGKRRPFAEAETGAIGLETLLPASLRLHHGGQVGLSRIVEALTVAPARLLKLDRGTLQAGRRPTSRWSISTPPTCSTRAASSRARRTPPSRTRASKARW